MTQLDGHKTFLLNAAIVMQRFKPYNLMYQQLFMTVVFAFKKNDGGKETFPLSCFCQLLENLFKPTFLSFDKKNVQRIEMKETAQEINKNIKRQLTIKKIKFIELIISIKYRQKMSREVTTKLLRPTENFTSCSSLLTPSRCITNSDPLASEAH